MYQLLAEWEEQRCLEVQADLVLLASVFREFLRQSSDAGMKREKTWLPVALLQDLVEAKGIQPAQRALPSCLSCKISEGSPATLPPRCLVSTTPLHHILKR